MTTTRTLLLFACLAAASAHNTKLKEIFTWKQLDFNYPNNEARETAKLTGEFIPKNNLPLGVEVWRNRVFVTVPRWKAGVPASLTYSIYNPDGAASSPQLIPYPNWETNALPKEGASENDTHIISTFRVRVDACDRLWVMDTGLADILGTPKSYTSPQILIYDLKTDTLMKKFTIPADQIKEHAFFANIIVDTDGENMCDDAFAYIPDLGSYAIVVYSLKDNESWRVKHHFFNFDPLNGDFNVGGVNFQWTDGVFGIALSKRNEDGFKTAYFHALSSTNEFTVSTEVLRNKTAASDYHAFKLLGNRGPNTQSSASFLDEKSGVLFYTQINRDGVGCWNTKEKEYSEATQGLATQDNETFVFTNDLKVDRDSNLWVLSDRMPAFIYKGLDPEQVNFRIFTAKVEDAIRGTVCERANEDAVKKEEMKIEATQERRDEVKIEEQVDDSPRQVVRTVSNVMRSFSRKS